MNRGARLLSPSRSAEMEKQLMRQFQEYGSVAIGGNILIIFLICSLAYPVFSDPRILAVMSALMIAGFAALFGYYLYRVRGIIRLALKKDEGSLKQIERDFRSFATLTFYLNMLLLSVVFIPLIVVMYLALGYTNIYYHFYVLFLNVFIIIFLAYRSLLVWYGRTYPMGRFGLPVKVQDVGSKIAGLVLPTVLLASVAFTGFVYFVNRVVVRDAVDARVADGLESFAARRGEPTGAGGARRIRETIESVNAKAQEFAARSEKLSVSSDELKEMAFSLRDKLKRFTL